MFSKVKGPSDPLYEGFFGRQRMVADVASGIIEAYDDQMLGCSVGQQNSIVCTCEHNK